jgi:hypothetical protein
MKELHSPWNNWESKSFGIGETKIPGVADLFTSHADLLGARQNGPDLEKRVTAGNLEWAKTRIELLKTKGTAELLRPLFCTVDINLASGQVSVGPEFFLDQIWLNFDLKFSLGDGTYTQLLTANHQRIVDRTGAQLSGAAGPVVDTFFAFTFPQHGKQDIDYVQALVNERIVDDDFVKDVRAIDFTRPIFSPTRCGLLDFAPKLDASGMTPDGIREGFKASLSGEPAGADLLKNLEDTNDASAHGEAVAKFVAACRARPPKDVLADALRYASHLRNVARSVHASTSEIAGQQSGQGIIEFAETLPVDDLPDSAKKLDPIDCTLK